MIKSDNFPVVQEDRREEWMRQSQLPRGLWDSSLVISRNSHIHKLYVITPISHLSVCQFKWLQNNLHLHQFLQNKPHLKNGVGGRCFVVLLHNFNSFH